MSLCMSLYTNALQNHFYFQGYDYSNRRRLSTPSPSPTREIHKNANSESTHGSWFKSLDRLSRKKSKKVGKLYAQKIFLKNALLERNLVRVVLQIIELQTSRKTVSRCLVLCAYRKLDCYLETFDTFLVTYLSVYHKVVKVNHKPSNWLLEWI